MDKKLINSLSKYLSSDGKIFTEEGVHILKTKEISACGDKGILAISTSNGVLIQCDPLYYNELNSIYEGANKLDFFEINNLSILESLAREYDRLLSGPYLVLTANKINTVNHTDNKDYRLELRSKNNNDLHQYEGFDNSLSYDDESNDELSLIVWHSHQPVCIATATCLHDDMYSIGINVLPEWRRKGIGIIALTSLTEELLKKEKIPHYSVSIANTGSINLALKAGYRVSYTTVYTVI